MRALLALLSVALTLAVCNALVGALGLAPAVIELPSALTVSLGHTDASGVEDMGTFVFDPDPLIRWRATDAPRTVIGPGSGALHVGLLGDSEVYGYCAGRAHALDWQLVGLDPDLRVTNFAVSGYDAEQEAMFAIREARSTAPPLDQLVWVVHFNDRQRGTYNALMRDRDPSTLYLAATGSWLIRHVPLVRWGIARYTNALAAPMLAPTTLFSAVRTAIDAPLLVVPLPQPDGTLHDDPTADAIVAGADVLHVGPWIRDPASWCDGAHLSARGKRRMAHDILARLRGER